MSIRKRLFGDWPIVVAFLSLVMWFGIKAEAITPIPPPVQIIKASTTTPIGNWAIDKTSITAQGNQFNGGNQLIQADPNGNLVELNRIFVGTTTSNAFRTDTSLELSKSQSGFAIFDSSEPYSTNSEGFFAIGGFDNLHVKRKRMSISSKWVDASAGTGYGVLRLNATIAGGTNEDVAYRQFGGHGITLWGPNDVTSPGFQTLQIYGTLLSTSAFIATPSAENVLFRVGASSFSVTTNGHVNFGGGTPTLSSCGISPAPGSIFTDAKGYFSTGSGTTVCTLTFNKPFANPPVCLISPYNAAGSTALAPAAAGGGNSVVFSNLIASQPYNYICIGE